jgi:hypothetical protein
MATCGLMETCGLIDRDAGCARSGGRPTRREAGGSAPPGGGPGYGGPNSLWGESWGPRKPPPNQYAGSGPTLIKNRRSKAHVPRPGRWRQWAAEAGRGSP